MLRKVLYIIIDILVLCFSFLFFIWIKPASKRVYLPNYIVPFLVLVGIWIIVSFVAGKYNFSSYRRARKVFLSVWGTNIAIAGIASLLMVIFYMTSYSRLIVFGTIVSTTVFETILAFITISVFKAGTYDVVSSNVLRKPITLREDQPSDEKSFVHSKKQLPPLGISQSIIDLAGINVLNFIQDFVDLSLGNTSILATTTKFNVENLADNVYHNIVNLNRVNDIRRINKFFESVNRKMPESGIYICCAQTYQTRKKMILKRFPKLLGGGVYFFDFIINRVFPKIWGFKTIYFWLIIGRNRVISRAEVLGRLVSCGFEIVDYKRYNNKIYIASKKVSEPAYDQNPTYGPLIKMSRVGKNGKIIKVYKIRTMHPYSEYLQGYVFEKYDLDTGGKFNNDFSITTVGKIMRKLWIDELPMILNVLKGEMKIVGVRPLSKHYFSLYSKELQEKRILHKPGLVPPFYVDKPDTLEEIMASEMKYLEAYERNPFATDLQYFFKSFYNILFKKYRSA